MEVQQKVVDFLNRQDLVSPEILRACRAGRLLRLGGVWQQGGDWYQVSYQTQRIGCFVSHSWRGSRVNKALLLLCFFNGVPACACGLLGAAVGVSLLRVGVLERTTVMAIVPVCCGLLLAALSLLLWPSRTPLFVDKACIHQTDHELKAKGILSLGGILKRSEAMVCCWEESWTLRLWCIFEIAGFIHSRGKARVYIAPTTWGPCLMAISVILCCAFVLQYFLQASELASVPRMLVLAVTSLAIVLPMPLAVLSFRRHFRAVDALLTQLSSFELAKTHCHCCDVAHLDGALVCDREVIYRCIGAWFGSKERFETLVKSEVLAICREQLGSCGLPYSWLVVAGAPVIWASSDAMVQAFVDGEWTLGVHWILWTLGWWLGAIPLLFAWSTLIFAYLRRKRSGCMEVMVTVLATALIWVIFAFIIVLQLLCALVPTPFGTLIFALVLLLLVYLSFSYLSPLRFMRQPAHPEPAAHVLPDRIPGTIQL